MAETDSNQRSILVTLCVSLVIATVAAPLAYICLLASGVVQQTAAIATAGIVLGIVIISWPLLPRCLQPRNTSQRWLFLIWLALSLFASYRVARLSAFMCDESLTDYAFAPQMRSLGPSVSDRPFFPRHYCFTAYVVAAELAAEHVDNIYEPELYDNNAEIQTPVHRVIGDHHPIDLYQYPPPFLLLPRALMPRATDFFRARTYWFAINVMAIGATFLALGYWVGGRAFGPYWLSWPLVMMAPVTLASLQIGNVHFFIICISILAMICFETRLRFVGGILLGFAIVAKLFPGVLLAYLLFRRRWSPVVWTCVAMAGFIGGTVYLFGAEPFAAFWKFQLPRIASGDAFGFAREYLRPMTVNMSIMAIVYKLDHLGSLDGLDVNLFAQSVLWGYTLILLALVIIMGVQHRRFDQALGPGETSPAGRQAMAVTWLVLLTLGQLRSPFVPWLYGNMILVWLIALLMHDDRRWLDRAILLALAWAVFAIMVPLPFGPETIDYDMVFTLFAGALMLLITFGLAIWELTRTQIIIAGRRLPETRVAVAAPARTPPPPAPRAPEPSPESDAD